MRESSRERQVPASRTVLSWGMVEDRTCKPDSQNRRWRYVGRAGRRHTGRAGVEEGVLLGCTEEAPVDDQGVEAERRGQS